LLPCPEFPDTFWSFKHVLEFIRQYAALAAPGLSPEMPPWAEHQP